MPIRLQDLTRASVRSTAQVSLEKASANRLRTAFLCHSHSDRVAAIGLATLLGEAGWDVYIDWQDPFMPAVPNRQTATNLQDRIRRAAFFLFLATQNSLGSRWCPWEIGYANGVKAIDSIVAVPTRSADGTEHGSEYLQLYRSLDLTSNGTLAVWQPGMTSGGVLLRNL